MDAKLRSAMKPTVENLLAADFEKPGTFDDDIQPLIDALGDSPNNTDMLAARLVHEAMSGNMRAYNEVLEILDSKVAWVEKRDD